jgi:hypothetical protein
MGSQLAALSLSLILPSFQDDWHKKAAFFTVLSFKNVWTTLICEFVYTLPFCAIMAGCCYTQLDLLCCSKTSG